MTLHPSRFPVLRVKPRHTGMERASPIGAFEERTQRVAVREAGSKWRGDADGTDRLLQELRDRDRIRRDKSVLAVDRALSESRVIMLVAQRDASIDNPNSGDLHTVGTLATILQLLKLPDGTVSAVAGRVARSR